MLVLSTVLSYYSIVCPVKWWLLLLCLFLVVDQSSVGPITADSDVATVSLNHLKSQALIEITRVRSLVSDSVWYHCCHTVFVSNKV